MSRCCLLVQVLTSKDFLSNHAGNSHHCGATIVEFGVLLTNLLGGFLLPVVDFSKPDSVVTIKLGGGPPGKLNQCGYKNDLGKSSRWDLEKSTDTRVNIGELQVVGWRQVSIESPLVVVNESAKHSHHGNASVLAFNGSVAGEFLVIGNVSKRVEETKGSSGANFLLRNLKRGAGFNLFNCIDDGSVIL